MSDRAAVVVTNPIHEDGLARLGDRFDVSYLPDIEDESERQAALAAAQAVIVRTFSVDAAVMAALPRLGLVAKHGAGYDNIDVAEATARGILVANAPGGANATAVGEGAVGLMLALVRQIREMDALVREGRFTDRWSVNLGDLTGKRLGIVGLGRIGRVTARICGVGFDMPVSAYDPFVDAAVMEAHGVGKVDSLTALMGMADVVSIHVPLSDDTRGLIGEGELHALRESAFLINTSRGGVIDEAALIAALAERRFAGAGIDVFEDEPPAPDNPLFAMDNVVLSPHVAGITRDSVRGMTMKAVGVVEDVFAGRAPATLLNPSVWDSRRLR